ncbi:MAG: hypothetical protein AAB410_01880 [Patescibacteria group bacterium]
MKKKITDEFPTKAKKRELKKRPRMRVHGRALKTAQTHAGKKLSSQ